LPKYCMVATDLDSTLLNNKHQISERNAAMLRKLHDMGLHVSVVLSCDIALLIK